jgi:hypothetical protein
MCCVLHESAAYLGTWRRSAVKTLKVAFFQVTFFQVTFLISFTHKRTEGRAPVWGSEFTLKDAAIQGDPSETAATKT